MSYAEQLWLGFVWFRMQVENYLQAKQDETEREIAEFENRTSTNRFERAVQDRATELEQRRSEIAFLRTIFPYRRISL